MHGTKSSENNSNGSCRMICRGVAPQWASRYTACCYFFFQAEDGIRDVAVTGVQTCALPILGVIWSLASIAIFEGFRQRCAKGGRKRLWTAAEPVTLPQLSRGRASSRIDVAAHQRGAGVAGCSEGSRGEARVRDALGVSFIVQSRK